MVEIHIAEAQVNKKGEVLRYVKDNGSYVGVAELEQEKQKGNFVYPANLIDKDGYVKGKVDKNEKDLKVKEVSEEEQEVIQPSKVTENTNVTAKPQDNKK